MKTSKKLLTVLCTCFMAFGLAGGVVTTTNVSTYLAKAEISAEEQAKNEAFIKRVKQFSTYSADVLDTYLKPVWNTDEIVDESATIVGPEGFTRLLYAPVEGSVVIRDYHNEHYYIEGIDFEVHYSTGDIIRLKGGDLPYFELNEYLSNGSGQAYTIPFDKTSQSVKNDEALSNTAGLNYVSYYADRQRLDHHFNVSYRVNMTLSDTAEGRWGANFENTSVTNLTEAFTPQSQADVYSDFINQLYLQNEATVMFYGDSITFGCNATGFASGGGNYNPYLPRWSELVCEFLEREYGSKITYYNGAVGGWTTQHGVTAWNGGEPDISYKANAQLWSDYAKYPYEVAGDTDLLVLAFGMNDSTGNAIGWQNNGNSADTANGINTYKNNLKTIINDYLTRRGDKGGSVLLMSHMMPNTQSTWYTADNSLHQQIEDALEDIVDDYQSNDKLSIAVAPVSSVFKTMEEKGKFTRNVLSNNINHPTDFGVRIYAQTVLQTLTGYASDSVQMGDTVIGNNKLFIGEGASVRMNSVGMDSNMHNSYLAGIRYRAYVSDEFFKNGVFDSENYEAGMWIVPEQFLNATGIEFNQDANKLLQEHFYGKYYDLNTPGLTEDEIKDYQDKQLVQTIPTEIWDERENGKVYGYHSFNSAVIKIPDTMFATDLVARAYVLDKNTGTYYVSRGMQCRNISQVSSMALATETNFTPTQTRLLQWFIDNTNQKLSDTFIYNQNTSASYVAPNTNSESAVLNLTKGDYLQFPKTSAGVVPMVFVLDEANQKLVPINQMYSDLISYDTETGKMTVINNPSQAMINFRGYVTLQSIASLEETYGKDIYTSDFHDRFTNDPNDNDFNDQTRKIAITFYNSEFETPANNTTYKTGASITFDKPYMKYAEGTNYVYFSNGWAKDANGRNIEAPVGTTLTDNGNGTMTLKATSGNLLGKYTLYANAISPWGGTHTVATKAFTIKVVNGQQYATDISTSAGLDAGSDFIACGEDFTWYCGNDDCRMDNNTYSFTQRDVTKVNKYQCQTCGEIAEGNKPATCPSCSGTNFKFMPFVKETDDGLVYKYKCTGNGCDYGFTDSSLLDNTSHECGGTIQYIAKLNGEGNGLCPLCKTYSLVDENTVADGIDFKMDDYYWYDATEDAYHYQSVDAHYGDNTAPTTLGIGSLTMDTVRFKNNSDTMNNYMSAFTETKHTDAEGNAIASTYTCKYNYFLFDIKFTYANGTVLDGLKYDNTLAFWTKTESEMDGNPSAGVKWLTSRSGSDLVYFFDADDASATPLSHADIIPGNWYTIALDPVVYIKRTWGEWADKDGVEDVFAMFCAHAEKTNATGIGSDFYFKNFRFADVLGSDLEALEESKTEYASTASGTSVDYDSANDYWVYTTTNGLNAQLKYNGGTTEYTKNGESVYDGGLHAVKPEGTLLNAYNENCLKYNYFAIDVYFPSASNASVPHIMFKLGAKTVCDGAGWETLVKTDKVADSLLHRRYLVEDLTYADTSACTKDVWYTYVVKAPGVITDYLFGVITPSNSTIESHTVYFKNARFLDEIADSYTTNYTSSDWYTEPTLTVSELKIRNSYNQEDGYQTNPNIPYSTTDFDATLTDNVIGTINTTSVTNLTQDQAGSAWFGGGHKLNTTPESLCNSMTVTAVDDVLTQFRFTNYGYTYSDRILFDAPIHVSQISSLTLRMYLVASQNSVFPANYTGSGYQFIVYRCAKCKTYYSENQYMGVTTANDATLADYKDADGNVIKDAKGYPTKACNNGNCGGQITGNYKHDEIYYVVDPANQTADYVYSYDADAWEAAYSAGAVSGILDANGNLTKGTKTRNPYDTRYGGIRLFPYGATTNTGGYMFPADIKQGAWIDYTITDPSVLADDSGWIWGFWIGQSAYSGTLNGTVDTFINLSVENAGCAYMNLDRILATSAHNGQTILCDMHADTHGLNGSGASTAVDALDPYPYDDADCTMQTAPSFTGWTSVEVNTQSYNGKSLIQFYFNKKDEAPVNKVFSKVLFKAPIHVSTVKALYLRFYAPYPWNSTADGGVRIHAYGDTSVTGGVSITFTKGGEVYFTISDPKALAEADGYIRGFWISQASDIDTDGTIEEHYMNLDYIAMTSQIAYDADEDAYLFSTATGAGTYEYTDPKLGHTRTVSESHRYRLASAYNSIVKERISSHKYASIDIKFLEGGKNNLIFTQGITDANEWYYGLKTGFKIDGTDVKQVLIYERGDMDSAYKQTVAYEDMQEGVWYTLLVPLELHKGANGDVANYIFGIMTYAGDTTEGTDTYKHYAGCTAYLDNFKLVSSDDLVVIGDDGTDTFDRFVSPNTSYVEYADYEGIGKAYKLNENGYIGLSDEAKAKITPSIYSRMTMEFYLGSYDEGDNVIFWNRTGTAIGLREKYDDGVMSVDDIAVVYDADGNRVDLANIQAGQWYTLEILNPQLDWAFLGNVNTEVYFRNMIWHRGLLVEKSTSDVPDLTAKSHFNTSDF